MSNIADYLDMIIAFHERHPRKGDNERQHRGMEEFVKAEGIWFKPPTSSELPEGIPRGVIKECYSNCWNYLAENPNCGLTYCEGYAFHLIPTLHAWLATPDGEVIDPTWPEPGTEYFGVPFKWGFAFQTVLNKETYGVIDDWSNKWPLVRGLDPVKWRGERVKENA